jgi:hypothetical protein
LYRAFRAATGNIRTVDAKAMRILRGQTSSSHVLRLLGRVALPVQGKGWKPPPKELVFKDTAKVREMARRGNGLIDKWDRDGFELALAIGSGGIWLRLTDEQYRALGAASGPARRCCTRPSWNQPRQMRFHGQIGSGASGPTSARLASAHTCIHPKSSPVAHSRPQADAQTMTPRTKIAESTGP